MKPYLLFLFCVALHAQVPLRQTSIQIYDRPNSTVKRQEFSSGTQDIFNSAGARRISQSSAGGLSTTAGIIEIFTGAAGSEVSVNRLDAGGITSAATIRGANVQGGEIHLRVPDGRLVISSSHNSPASGSALAFGSTIWSSQISGGSSDIAQIGRSAAGSGQFRLWTAGTSTPFLAADNQGVFLSGAPYYHEGLSGKTSVGVCGAGEIPKVNQLSGGLATSFTCVTEATDAVTLTSNQTITGAKIFKAAITIEDALSSTDRSVLGSGALNLNNTSGASRVLASSSNSLDSSTGIVRVFTGAPGLEALVAGMDANGVTATNFWTASGLQLFNTSGACVSCTIPWARITGAPSSGGDMLLGTSQTVTALKTFQMSFGGNAIQVNNSIGQLRGAWNDATLSIGEIAAGFGRGVQVSTGGTLSVLNASSQVAVRLSTSGSSGSISAFDASTGIFWTGMTLTCSVGQTVRQPIHVAGLLVSGGCGI
jgi:hypothetical protein